MGPAVYPKILTEIVRLFPLLSVILPQRENFHFLYRSILEERDQLKISVDSCSKNSKELRQKIVLLEQDRIALLDKIALVSEKLDAAKRAIGELRGYCSCCRQNTLFEIKGSWLRDQYLCSNCFSIPRQRHIQFILDRHFEGWEKKIIHESSPSNNFIAQYCINYSSSQYFSDVERGLYVNFIRNENLEALTFPDCCFDIFITQDVFEHLFNPARAIKEIMRVLRPGGIHIFTVPKYSNIKISYPRAKIVNSKIQHLMNPEYHGNPVGDGKTLVTWDYGEDVEQLFNIWSAGSTTTYVTSDRRLGIDGDFLEVFVIKKKNDVRSYLS